MCHVMYDGVMSHRIQRSHVRHNRSISYRIQISQVTHNAPVTSNTIESSHKEFKWVTPHRKANESRHTEFKWDTLHTIESCLVHIRIPNSNHYARKACETHLTKWVMSHRIQMNHVKHNRVMPRTHSNNCTRRVRETHFTKALKKNPA